MKFGRAHKVVTYLFAGLGLLALVQGSSFSTGMLGFMGLAFVASWFAEPPRISPAGYTRFWTYLAVGVLLIQILRAFTGSSVLSVGVEYAAFLQLSKLAHRKVAADFQQIAILGFLHLIAGTVLSSGLEYGGIFFGFVIVMPWMLALTHLRVEMERQHGEGSEALTNQLNSCQHTTPAFFGGTILLSVPLFIVTAAFFFAFPRVGFGFFSQFGIRTQAVAGFGDDVELGGFGTIRDDPTVVMRVKPAKMQDPPAMTLSLRLRGTSFDQYGEGRWSRSPARLTKIRRSGETYPLIRRHRASDYSYEIILDPMEEPVLFLPPGAVSLRIAPEVESGRRRHKKLRYSPGLDVRYEGVLAGPLTYTAYVDPKLGSFREPVNARQLSEYTEVPDDYEQVAELARGVVGAETDHRAIATKIEKFLRNEGGYRYTLKQPDTGDGDPLHVFLFKAKAGHCEYFSTAMAIMLRTLGIPTRNVTGFVGADYNPYGNYYAVRNGNAHSWVEVLLDGSWSTFDPTPSSVATTGLTRTWLTRFRQVIDAARVRWAQYVVEYNVRDQTRALGKAMSWLRSFRRTGQGPAAKLAQRQKKKDTNYWRNRSLSPDWRLFSSIMIAFIVIFGIARLLQRRKRFASAGRKLDERRDRALRLYITLEESLRKAGHPRPPDSTPREHAEALAESGFPAADDVRSVTNTYLDARFGSGKIDNDEFARLHSLARGVASERGRYSGRPGPRATR